MHASSTLFPVSGTLAGRFFLLNILQCVIGVAACLVVGCAKSTNAPSSTDTSAVSGAASVSGNWMAVAKPTSGSLPVSGFSGVLNQTGDVSNFGVYITSVLHVDAPCFAASPSVPLQGNIKAGVLEFDSYVINGQALHLDATASPTGDTIEGTYSVSGGCAAGAIGSFSAKRYSSLTGTYTGSSNSAVGSVPTSITLSQAPDATGTGTFLLAGTIDLSGIGCSLRAVAGTSSDNFAQGNHFAITFKTLDGATEVDMTGTFDQNAANVSPQSFLVKGGNCSGIAAPLLLSR